MTEITFKLTGADIRRAARELKKYERRLDERLGTAVLRLAEAGESEARAKYSAVPATVAPEDDPSDVHTIIEDFTASERRHIDLSVEGMKQNKLVRYILAQGSGVGFAEFGAGAYADYSHPYADEAPFAVYPASWSEQDKQQYLLHGKWWFSNLIYYGIEPARGLYAAAERIKQEAPRIVREAFREGNDT